MTIWKVHPDDPDMEMKRFTSKQVAQDWADGLCCSYWIEEVRLWW